MKSLPSKKTYATHLLLLLLLLQQPLAAWRAGLLPFAGHGAEPRMPTPIIPCGRKPCICPTIDAAHWGKPCRRLDPIEASHGTEAGVQAAAAAGQTAAAARALRAAGHGGEACVEVSAAVGGGGEASRHVADVGGGRQ